MNIRVDTFHGIQPRVHPSLLADGMAVRAHNCRLKSGKLVPLRQPRLIDGASIILEGGLERVKDAKSIHAWKRYNNDNDDIDFLLFSGITWMAEGNLADDDKTRVIVSGETGVSFTEHGETDVVHENVPAFWIRENGGVSKIPLEKEPLPAPKVARSNGSPALTSSKRYAHFFWTWVDRYGYESPSSLPSIVESSPGVWTADVIEYDNGDTITFSAVGVSNWPDGAEKIRVYKTASGTSEQTDGIQFVCEKDKSETLEMNSSSDAYGSGGFVVKVLDEMLGESMPNIEPPPHDLRCIHAVPGGYYVGISPLNQKTVFFSDIGLVYSWPIAYRYDVSDNVVALAVTSNTVFVLTDGWPYVLSGTAPESMTVAKLAGPAACVSRRGVCVYRNGVYYASNEGLMAIVNDADAGTVCTNLTQKIFTKDQWQAMNPSSCLLAQYDGALFLFFRDTNNRPLPGLVIDLAEGADAVTTHDEAARCVCTDNKTDTMYFVREEV